MMKFFKQYILVVVFGFLSIFSCNEDIPEEINYRMEMRNFIIKMSEYARNKHNDFIIIPQNGQELLTHDGSTNGIIFQNYVKAINATAREDLLYGYYFDDIRTPENISEEMINLCNLYVELGIEALIIDYCSSYNKIDSSYSENYKYGFVSFAASDRNLRVIPSYPLKPFNENGGIINSMHEVQNFLYLINSENFSTKTDFINAVSATFYDLVVIDLFHFEEAYTKADIELLKLKPNGNNRLVVCYLSIGEAEDYRYYWSNDWVTSPPLWLHEENNDWKGNYKVEFWNSNWQQLIYGSENSYLDKIIAAGFDGVWLDLVDAYEYFE